ncbi:dihydropyrimidinase-related protein 2 isoform X1 [Arapaima gigas]
MSAAGDVPAFFKNMGSGSPKPRPKFCGMFCPVEGAAENKTLDLDSLSAAPRAAPRDDPPVIDRQRDVASPRRVEIRRSAGKEALQNLGDPQNTETEM